ncbi:MAG: hypothetical protein IJ258_10925 [Methanobrevibacter sp.]|uniref:hypothetical protein n=1 Tax=Methanobrevibacter sp. TaxID=66852 RepID=UPI0025D7A1F3|nr:hypothetical protein [Methanobrevibacter sp.]MBQ8018596.1 hypothetical protein [Methanobrevibacter sp.]
MDIIQKANEKLMIITIIVGFALGIYLGIGHDNPDLWFIIVQWIVITTLIMTFISTLVGVYAKLRNDEVEFDKFSPLRILILNLAIIAVCTSFGFVFCSILIGNYNTAN